MEFNLQNYQKPTLRHLLAVYKNSEFTAIEHYDIDDKTNLNKLPSATNLSVDVANEIFKHLKVSKGEHMTFKGIIPNNIIYNNTNTQTLVWKWKSQKQELVFDNKQFKDANYHLPNLIFKLKENKLSVFAVKSNRITKNTKLYHAPFLNIFEEGGICMGSATIDKENILYYDDLIKIAENNFFNSKFTHTNFNNSINGNIIEMYQELLKTEKFNTKYLIENNNKIQDLWKA